MWYDFNMFQVSLGQKQFYHALSYPKHLEMSNNNFSEHVWRPTQELQMIQDIFWNISKQILY